MRTVHDAIQSAQDEQFQPAQPMEPCTFKVRPETREMAEQICERHGVSMSAFVRNCVEGLVRDYVEG